jgi:general secretion pathway protein H
MSKRARQAGFTLIELIVVVAVIAVITGAVVTGVGNLRGASVQAEAGKIAVAVRYLYNLSVISGRNHRLVMDLDARTFWGEEQSSSDPCDSFLLPGTDAEEEEAQEGDVTRNAGFSASESQLLQRVTLDTGIRFLQVHTTHQDQPQEKGQAYIYFFPSGTAENAVVQLEGDEDDIMTVEVFALQGNAKVHTGAFDLDGTAKEGL